MHWFCPIFIDQWNLKKNKQVESVLVWSYPNSQPRTTKQRVTVLDQYFYTNYPDLNISARITLIWIFLHETPWFEYFCTTKKKSCGNRDSHMNRYIHLCKIVVKQTLFYGLCTALMSLNPTFDTFIPGAVRVSRISGRMAWKRIRIQ